MGEMADYYLEQQLDSAAQIGDTIIRPQKQPGSSDPIWTTASGIKFYRPGSITDSHLLNIYSQIIRRKGALPDWLVPEIKRRKLSCPGVTA